MPKSNAQRQAEYRDRYLKNPDEEFYERINMIVSLHTKLKVDRLASYYGVTKREALAQALDLAEQHTLNSLSGRDQDAYYDQKISLLRNDEPKKKGEENGPIVTDGITI